MFIKLTYHICKYRRLCKFSQKKLEAISEVTRARISDAENQKANLTIDSICRIAYALKVEPSQLYSYKVQEGKGIF